MAKHLVICPECGKQFDAEAEACEYDPSSRRYTCADCVRAADEARKKRSQELEAMLDKAVDAIIRKRTASITVLQQELGVGYSTAAGLLDKLAEKGVVGPFDPTGPREILIELPPEEKTVQPSNPPEHTPPTLPPPSTKMGCLPKIIIGVLVLAILLGALSALGRQSRERREQEEAATAEAAAETDERLAQAVQPIIDAYMAEYEKIDMADEVNIHYSQGTLWFDITIPGAGEMATLAKNGHTQATEEWNTLIDNSMSLSLNARAVLDDYGLTEVKETVRIMNDLNPAATITAISRGRVFFDDTGLRK